MSEIKGTPWTVFQNGFSKCAVKDADGNWLTYSAGDDRRMSREEVETNARLMAAAPELFEALTCLRDAVDRYFGPSKAGAAWPKYFDPEMHAAWAAIRKATGAAND